MEPLSRASIKKRYITMKTPFILIDNVATKGREEKFTTIEIDVSKIVTGWKASVYSFEWLLPNGQVKPPAELSESHAKQFKDVEASYADGTPMERPVLGLGMLDNVEIGSKKEVLLTLHSLGVPKMEVHIPTSCLKDFEPFM